MTHCTPCRSLLILGIGAAAIIANAQESRDAAAEAAAIAATVGEDFDCQIDIHGEPRASTFTDGWIVAFWASGGECDAAQGALVERGPEYRIEFMRRPNPGQLRRLIGPMIRSAELSSGCRIDMRGRPVFDSRTAQWFVHVAADGTGCASATADLSAQARDFEIIVLQGAPRTLQGR